MTNTSVLSASSLTYKWFLERLNDNPYGVKFEGNVRFNFWPQNELIQEFEIISKVPGELDFKKTEVVPVTNTNDIEVNFNEKNNRVDLEKEVYIALKIEHFKNPETKQLVIEFDEEDKRFKALMEAIRSVRANLTYDYEGKRISAKIKEPVAVQTMKHSGSYYTVFAVSMNMTLLDDGKFGNEISVQMTGGGETGHLDIYEMIEAIGSDTSRRGPLDGSRTQKTRTNTYNWQGEITVNYRPTVGIDGVLFDHIGLRTIQPEYTIIIDDNDGRPPRVLNVNLTAGSKLYRPNKVIQLQFMVELK